MFVISLQVMVVGLLPVDKSNTWRVEPGASKKTARFLGPFQRGLCELFVRYWPAHQGLEGLIKQPTWQSVLLA